jgi:hypothetical protein
MSDQHERGREGIQAYTHAALICLDGQIEVILAHSWGEALELLRAQARHWDWLPESTDLTRADLEELSLLYAREHDLALSWVDIGDILNR